MWNDTTPAVQVAAKNHFAAYPGTETMLAITDGNLYADDQAGENAARQYVREMSQWGTNGLTIVRLTRAGGTATFTPRQGVSNSHDRAIGGIRVGGLGVRF